MSNVTVTGNGKEHNGLPVKLLYATKSEYEGDWHSTMHMHPFTEIFYVVKGKGVFKVEDKELKVREDDLIIVNSNIRHTESSLGAAPLKYIVLGFEGMSLINNDQQKTLYGYSKYNYKAHKEEVLFFMELIHKELFDKEEHYESISNNLLQILLLNIIRNTDSKQSMSPIIDESKDCNYVKKYIDVNYASNITLDYLSSLVFINKYSLIREFKKFQGVSPIEYLINKRLNVSKTLLETTDYSMKQISQIVGFTSQSYFNQTFKKRIGKIPTEYRKKYKTK